ncbi:TonB-dependent receptor family protein [Thioalkalivibrio sulfidiphilus]|uniref:TonB-dependent receptor family protein n=1 Tax=Thioalkalivibrio sulfidiphilus TaxID=1033854 RepID=UPI003B31475A
MSASTCPSRCPDPGALFSLRSLPCAVAAALGTLALLPATTMAEGQLLPRIEVVGSAEEDKARQPGAVGVVTEEDLELWQPLSTEDALRHVPGVHIKREEESAVVANIGIRGLSASDYKTLILEDGVPVAPGLFVGNGRYFNPRIQRMEGIEVLKGPAAVRYGPNTVGGVINYLTKTPEDGVVVSGRVGSHNLRESTVELGGSAPSGDAIIGAVVTWAESDGFMDKGYRMSDVMVKGGMAVGEDQWIGVKFSHYNNDANISYRGLFPDAYEAGAKFNPAPDDYFLTERQAFDVNHEWQISDAARLNTVLYWSQMYRDYWRFGLVGGSPTTVIDGLTQWNYSDSVTGNNRAFERVGMDSRLRVDHGGFGMRNEAEIGLRYMDESMIDTRVRATREQPRHGLVDRNEKQTAQSLAVFAENRFFVNDRLAITPGLRVETYEQRRDDRVNNANDGKSSNTELLPGVGATFQLNPQVQFYGGIYRAFAPPLNNQSIVTGVDQKLDAERSTNVEVGVRGRQGNLRYEVTAFQMDFSNQVTPAVSGDLANANAGSTLHRGLEFMLGYDWANGVFVDANLTYIPTSEYREDRGNGVDKGNRLPYSPELVANLSVGYISGPLKTALSGNYVSEQYGDGQNSVDFVQTGVWGGRMPSYYTFDLTGIYDVNARLSVFGAVKNLTDERYIGGLRQGIYVGPERSFEAGARYRF